MRAVLGLLAIASTSASASVPAPPPRPVADDSRLQEAITKAEACYSRQTPLESKARSAAEAATRSLSGTTGNADWFAAKQVVVAYLSSRKATMSCINELRTFRPSKNVHDYKIWSDAYRGWLSAYEGQTRFQLAILEKLIVGPSGEWELERPYMDP